MTSINIKVYPSCERGNWIYVEIRKIYNHGITDRFHFNLLTKEFGVINSISVMVPYNLLDLDIKKISRELTILGARLIINNKNDYCDAWHRQFEEKDCD